MNTIYFIVANIKHLYLHFQIIFHFFYYFFQNTNQILHVGVKRDSMLHFTGAIPKKKIVLPDSTPLFFENRL
jgi:hypothetical protein